MCEAEQVKHHYDREDLVGEEWKLNVEEIAVLDVQGSASPMEVEGKLPQHDRQANG